MRDEISQLDTEKAKKERVAKPNESMDLPGETREDFAKTYQGKAETYLKEDRPESTSSEEKMGQESRNMEGSGSSTNTERSASGQRSTSERFNRPEQDR